MPSWHAVIIMTFSDCEVLPNACCFSHQHSWLKRSSNQLTYTTEMIRGKTQTVGGSITCLMTFYLTPNTWSLTWSQHFLSVITTERSCFLALSAWWSVGSNRARKHAHFVSWSHSHAPHISRDHRDDQQQKMWVIQSWELNKMSSSMWLDHHNLKSWLHKMSPSMWWSHQLFWVSPLIITVELVTLTLFCFSRNLSWLCQWHFAELITVKKRSWHSDWPSDGPRNVTKYALVTPIVLSITADYHNYSIVT